MLVHDFLINSAKKYPGKVALVQRNNRFTYDDILREAVCFANYLLKKGCSGTQVAISLQNSREYVVAYYGTLMAGACCVPFDPNLGTAEVEYRLEHSEATLWVTSTRSLKKYLKKSGRFPANLREILVCGKNFSTPEDIKVSLGLFDFNDTSVNVSNLPRVDEDSLASIIYTSGSTGKPKGVMLTHENIVSNTLSIVEYQNLSEKDIHMVVLPFHYVMGKSLLNTHFCAGGSVVLNNGFVFPNKVLEDMVEKKVTGFSGVPSTYALLLHRSAIRSYRDKLKSLRFVAQAGGHLAARLKKELIEALPHHIKIYIMYGATEASARLSYLDPGKLSEKIDSIGKAIPGVTLKVMNGNKVLGPNEEGEIVASGPNIMKGYWKDPEETKKVLGPDGYRTGDLGFMDTDGYFYVTGRTKEMIKVGGNRVSPKEIEELIWNSGLVEEVAVIGVQDDILGEAIKAFVVPKNGRSSIEDDLRRYCGRTMPAYKVPKYFELARSLPKNSAGKILKSKLKESDQIPDVRGNDCASLSAKGYE